ncbi:transposase [Actinacidiphila oryziradicis]|uniref:Transposase n=1 Tax=Actinacidiphila oryziradicis TaxID=2571141 RepID=A0A4U0RSR0_9ACTN|nr:transposase [Actinacidiphila oryziradicis]
MIGRQLWREAISPTSSGPLVEPHLPIAAVGPIPDLRKHFNAVMWRFRVGSPWREEQSEEPQEDQVKHAQRHAIRDCHDRPELQSA